MEVTLKDVMTKVMTSFNLAQKAGNCSATFKMKSAPNYIPPSFKELHPSNEGTPIMIFSAPGAVGKTTLAKYFAYQKNSYYWDLSKIKLGDNTFIGTVAKQFGHENLASILGRLEQGEVSFFFDGFDEAEMLSGWNGVVDFVTEIYQYVRKSQRPNAIFFSRTETVELITLALEECDDEKTVYSLYEIDYFDRDGAIEFVKLVMRGENDESYNIHRQPFAETVDKIFEAIARGLSVDLDQVWIHERSRSFVGYSAVLQTVGRFLAGQNYAEIKSKFDAADSDTGLDVVSEFITYLLKREQKKVVDGLRDANSSNSTGFDEWDKIYSPDTQIKCLLAFINSNYEKSSIIPLIEAPAWLENAYVDAVSQFLPNHPFLRKGKFASPSFRDYSLAMLISHSDSEEEALRFMREKENNLSPLFANYYHKINEGRCKGSHVGYIYDSVSSKLKYGDSQLLTVSKSNGGNYMLDIIYGQEGQSFESTSFKLTLSKSSPLTFEKRLHNALIIIDSQVKIGGLSRSVELRDVEISSREISIDASEVIANCYDESPITLASERFTSGNPELRVKKIGKAQFSVNFPSSTRYPWSEYHDDNLSIPGSQRDVSEKVYALRLILRPFRKHNKATFGKQHEYIENIIVKDNAVRKVVFAKLLSKGVLARRSSSPMYELNENKLQEYGINWSDLVSLSVNDRLAEFLID